jgi:hypothetical protein
MPPEIIRLLPFLIIVPLVLWRMRRLSRKQPLKLNRLWVRPAILLFACAAALFLPQPGVPTHHFAPQDLLVLLPVIGLGAVAGWYMGRTMKIDVHPDEGTLMVQASPIALIVLLALVFGRFALRAGARMEAQAWHLDVGLVFDALIIFTAALFTIRSVEMYLRAKRVMQSHLNDAFS